MENMYTIYLRTNLVNGKQYVGETKNFKRREREWEKYNQPYANKYLMEEREKYGWENFEVEILSEVDTEDESIELEMYYIKKYNTKYPNGYNMSDGGKGTLGVKMPVEVKEKISKTKIGKKLSEEHKKKLSETHKGKMINHPSFSKPILQYTLDGQHLIKEYLSIADAARQTGICRHTIGRCCRGLFIQAGGFIWKYKNEGN